MFLGTYYVFKKYRTSLKDYDRRDLPHENLYNTLHRIDLHILKTATFPNEKPCWYIARNVFDISSESDSEGCIYQI